MDAPHLPYRLRPAAAADHDAIAGIWHAGASLPGVGPADMPSREDLRQRVDLEIAAGWEATIAEVGDAPVGFLAIRPNEATLNELFVRPDVLGRGVGKALLAIAMDRMPGGFSLFTRSANHRARRFYECAGLVVLWEDLHPRSGDPVIHYGWEPTRPQ